MALEPGIYDVRYRQNGILRGSGTLALEVTAEDDATSGVFNVAKGAAAQLVTDHPDALVALLLRRQEDEDTMEDRDTVADLLSGDVREADFTNYVRKTGLSGTIDVDDDGDQVFVDLPDLTWTSAGGAVNNVLVKLVVAVQTGADDTTLIPLTHHRFVITTNGSAIQAEFPANGFYRID